MSLNERVKHEFALSDQGARDLYKAIAAVTCHDLSLMVPVFILYFLIADLLEGRIPSVHFAGFAVAVVITLILIAAVYYWDYNATYFATYIETGVRRRHLAEKLRKIPLSYFGKKDLSDLSMAIMNDCTTMETAMSHWVPAFFASMISTGIIGLMTLFFNWKMALSILWVLPAAYLIIWISSKTVARTQKKANLALTEAGDGMQEFIETLRDLKSYNAQEKYKEKLDEKIRKSEKTTIISELTNAAANTAAKIVLKLGIATTLLMGSILLMQHEISVLVFLGFLIMAARFYDPLCAALDNFNAIMMVHNVACQRLDEILSQKEQEGRKELTNNGYDICFSHAGFGYDQDTPVLEDVSFTARQGEVTALVGPSGGGKTTVSRLAARFWDLNRGSITVGGMNIGKIEPETLLQLYSIVFQDVTLFNNTIMENIRLGRKGASDEEVFAAARLANVDEFADRLSDGYQTMIGENGCQLSGGERQRISIARAFLKDAPIILMDEATASLDVDNETLIQDALTRLIKNKTVMIIAHRMRTVANADKIVVLANGKVEEAGNHDELMKKKGVYASMVKNQMAGQEWSFG